MKGLFKTSISFLTGLIIYLGAYTASAQDNGTQYGENPSECQANLSLYRESFKQWKASNYTSDLNEFVHFWKACFTDCPRASEYIYLDGVTIMENFISKTQDPSIREKYADTLEMVFNNRIKYFPNDSRTKQSQEGNILWRKAISLSQWAPERVDTIYNSLKRAIELEQNNISYIPVPYYLKATIDMSKQNKVDTTIIIDNYDQLSDIVDANLKKAVETNNKQAEEEWTNTQKNLEQLIEPYASCDDLTNILQKKFDANPADVETLRKITATLYKKRCTDNDLFMKATENLFELDPSPQSAYMMATTYIKNTLYDKAIKALEDVIRLTDDDELKYSTEIKMAQLLIEQKRYPAAREHARKALQIRPNSGEAMLLIGKMYAASSDICENDEIAKKSVFWIAVDKFNEAKRIDPSVAEEANKLINTYRQYFPTGERLFFYSLSSGNSYKVECWINETTTIRTSD